MRVNDYFNKLLQFGHMFLDENIRYNRYYEKIGKEEPKCIEDELPFDIPESWCWTRINLITYSVGSKENQVLTSEILKTGTVPVVSQSQNLIDGYTNQIEKQILILPLIMFGDHTKVVKYIDFNFVIGADGTKFHKAILVLPKYLYLLVSYYALQMPSRGYARHYSLLKKLYMPLPPLKEQERIVAEIEKYEPLIAEYDKLEQEKSTLDGEIYDKLKKSILQYAIQGKLVPQDPNDEPASELLKRIRDEKKAQLGKKYVDSSIYKGDDNYYYEKIGLEIKNITEEIPFDIPNTWEWIRLGTLFRHNTGKALNSSNTKGVKRPYITTSNLYWGFFKLDKLREMLFTEEEIEKCSVHKGDLLVCEGGDIGRAAIWNYDYPIFIQNHIHKLRPYLTININFYYYLFDAYKSCGLIGGKGIGIQGLSSNALDKLLLPLPCICEQNRIVEKIIIITSKLKDED